MCLSVRLIDFGIGNLNELVWQIAAWKVGNIL